jgi:hypothetical protein
VRFEGTRARLVFGRLDQTKQKLKLPRTVSSALLVIARALLSAAIIVPVEGVIVRKHVRECPV